MTALMWMYIVIAFIVWSIFGSKFPSLPLYIYIGGFVIITIEYLIDLVISGKSEEPEENPPYRWRM